MATEDHALSDGFKIRLYDHGGLDVQNDAGDWITVASDTRACAELARLATLAANGKIKEE